MLFYYFHLSLFCLVAIILARSLIFDNFIWDCPKSGLVFIKLLFQSFMLFLRPSIIYIYYILLGFSNCLMFNHGCFRASQAFILFYCSVISIGSKNQANLIAYFSIILFFNCNTVDNEQWFNIGKCFIVPSFLKYFRPLGLLAIKFLSNGPRSSCI